MNINVLVMLIFFALTVLLSFITGGFPAILEGFKQSWGTVSNVWLLLLLAFGLSGFLQVLIPKDLISGYLGPGSGFRGYLIAWAVGAVTPGAPYVVLPIAASLLNTGAGIGQIMTMVLSASLGVAVTRIPYEIAFVGWRFTVIRILSAFILPLLGGAVAGYIGKFFDLA